MSALFSIWFQFLLCAALLAVAGVRLIRYGDAIAALTGLSRGWVGVMLVGTVTSLPELATGLSAVTRASSPDMAVGDALGSCVFNLAILAVADLLYRRESIYTAAKCSHLLSAGLSVLLTQSAALVLLLSAQGLLPTFGHVSLGSWIILIFYVMIMRTLYIADRQPPAVVIERAKTLSIKSAMTGYAATAAVVVGSGIWLPLIGIELARLMGWSNSFVGTLFVAMATSVPELATSWGALKIGAIDLLFGNLLGSNLFDVLILAIDDIAFLPGSLYRDLSGMHAITAMSAALMGASVVVALAYQPATRVAHMGSWASLALLATYLLNAVLQFMHQ